MATKKLYKQENGRNISVKGAKKKAWKAFARYIRQRDPYCVTCGSPTTEAGHYRHTTDKENQALGGNCVWYHEKNVHGQCGTCNRWKSGAADKYSLFLEETYGSGILQELNKLYLTPRKWTIEEILEIADTYTEKYENSA